MHAETYNHPYSEREMNEEYSAEKNKKIDEFKNRL